MAYCKSCSHLRWNTHYLGYEKAQKSLKKLTIVKQGFANGRFYYLFLAEYPDVELRFFNQHVELCPWRSGVPEKSLKYAAPNFPSRLVQLLDRLQA